MTEERILPEEKTFTFPETKVDTPMEAPKEVKVVDDPLVYPSPRELHALFSEEPSVEKPLPATPTIDDVAPSPSTDILNEGEKIKIEGLRQDILLKKITLTILFIFLAAETVGIFTFSYFQATRLHGFILEEWSFNLLVAATITQITFMLQLAVKHLFPEKNK